jgi:hypothetical protein
MAQAAALPPAKRRSGSQLRLINPNEDLQAFGEILDRRLPGSSIQ